DDDHLAIIAAKALLTDLQSRPHPSYYNTGFAIAAFMPESVAGNMMQRLAFELLVNGLGGYFQWKSHNGGEFSVLNALVYTGIMTAEEAIHPEQFQAYCTHRGCNYFVMRDAFLARITKKWKLPLTNPDLGGKKDGRVARDDQLLEKFKQWYPACVSSDGEDRVKMALARL
ncbi:MAG: hypothetical protein ACD_15C00090G0001, partial [uncultured bacterium]